MGLTYSSVVSADAGEVFAWHTRPGAITRLMPPWQPVRVVREAPSVRDGQAVLALSAVLRWRHTHQFAPAGESTTLVTDMVDTPVPAGLLRPMFGYRHRQLAADLAAHARARQLCPAPLTIAVTGSGGLVGTALAALLTTGGHRVIRLVRRPPRDAGEREWRPDAPDAGLLAGVDAVIHLAGASIAGRFTPAHKDEIRDSRIGPTRELARLAARSAPGLRAFVTASAVGDWEDAAAPAAAAGIRTVHVRTGIVQTPRCGTFSAGIRIPPIRMPGRPE